jgi:hypothetical protein
MVILEAIAADKKSDLHPGAVQLWKAKLESYRASEIKHALLAYQGEYMPSCDDIIRLIERTKQTKKREFVSCGTNGCVDGWRPVSNEKFARYQRCQCLLDHIAQVKGK